VLSGSLRQLTAQTIKRLLIRFPWLLNSSSRLRSDPQSLRLRTLLHVLARTCAFRKKAERISFFFTRGSYWDWLTSCGYVFRGQHRVPQQWFRLGRNSWQECILCCDFFRILVLSQHLDNGMIPFWKVFKGLPPSPPLPPSCLMRLCFRQLCATMDMSSWNCLLQRVDAATTIVWPTRRRYPR